MKRYIPLLALLLASLLYSQSKMDINNLIDRGGVKYAPNDDEPYKGKVFDFHENGQKKLDGNYRKGLMNGKWTYYFGNGNIYGIGNFINGDGGNVSEVSNIPRNGRNRLWIFYYENGQKKTEDNYKNSNPHGLCKSWYPNGQIESKVTNKDGKEYGMSTFWFEDGQIMYEANIINDMVNGKSTLWYPNGNKREEGTYKYGEWDGKFSWFYENGQNKTETTFKDGERDGLYTDWYENGQKSSEITFKDGERISRECWDADGNECECGIYGYCE